MKGLRSLHFDVHTEFLAQMAENSPIPVTPISDYGVAMGAIRNPSDAKMHLIITEFNS